MCDTRLRRFQVRQEREVRRKEKIRADGRREMLLQLRSRLAIRMSVSLRSDTSESQVLEESYLESVLPH